MPPRRPATGRQGSTQDSIVEPNSQPRTETLTQGTERQESDSSDDETPEVSQKQMVIAAKYMLTLDPEVINHKVSELVRFALFMESSRTPIRRKDIILKGSLTSRLILWRVTVLKDHAKGFPLFVQRARDMLQHLFGMDMVVCSAKRGNRGRRPAPTLALSQASSSSSNTWQLKSILSEKQRTVALSNSKSDVQRMTLLTVILALIYANSRSMREGTLYIHLKELGISRNSPHVVFGSIDAEMKYFLKLGYIESTKIRTAEGDTNTYTWGPRATTEISEAMIIRFITEMYPLLDDAGRRRLAVDIERNAGTL
ncbi:hypothetical protein BASA50_003545 [Batrachochytrium salamandrivorans]|uniref:MAGE domain-containing protein n=1 Tax=Batrachochytrium salamandrivorans TaxID=1357716 RepID=A0ABQ8FHQ7_9FUNG|nr:hypothetical protein BASA50_003545 [Batrachochytrium salamandrivorans]